MRTYADLIRGDFEAYIADVQEYFRCIDEERARAFCGSEGSERGIRAVLGRLGLVALQSIESLQTALLRKSPDGRGSPFP